MFNLCDKILCMRSNSNERITNSFYLREGGYRDPSLITKRKALYEYTTPHHIIENEVIKLARLEKAKSVLDIGCGEGEFLLQAATTYPNVHFTGLDISPNMFASAQERTRKENLKIDFRIGDAQFLPFSDESFDRVAAMHMIYHIPNIEKALSEMKRVLVPNGLLLLTTNSLQSKPTLKELKMQVAKLIGLNEYPDTTLRFNIEGGLELLKKYFANVQLIPFESNLRLTVPKPYVDYFDSTREFWNPIPDDQKWNTVLEFVKDYIQQKIDIQGEFQEKNLFGIFLTSG